MNQDTLKQLTDSLKPLSDKLGQGAAHLYEVYVRQMVAEGISSIVIAVFLLGLGVAAWVIFLRFVNTTELDDDAKGTGGLILVLLTAAMLIFALPLFKDGVLMLINPEYAAINRLLETIK